MSNQYVAVYLSGLVIPFVSPSQLEAERTVARAAAKLADPLQSVSPEHPEYV